MKAQTYAVNTLVNKAKKEGYHPIVTPHGDYASYRCPNCAEQAKKALKTDNIGAIPWVKLDNAIILKHALDDHIIHRCPCGYEGDPTAKTNTNTKTKPASKKGFEPPVQPAPVLCSKCHKNPVPPDRKSVCHVCIPPSKKAQAKAKEPATKEAAPSKGKAIY